MNFPNSKMKKTLSAIAMSVMVTFSFSASLAHADANNLGDLLEQVKQDRISEGKINKQREAEFLSERADKKDLLKKAKQALANEKARSKSLNDNFAENEITLANKETELENAKGTLGEMFGVVRRAANETTGRISTSLVSAQYPGRDVVLNKLSEAKELPTLHELEELWIALQTEMTESGKIVKFPAKVTKLDGTTSEQTITRVGTFNLLGEDLYLRYNDQTSTIQPLGRQPEGHVVGTVSDFAKSAAAFAPLYMDPSKGQILGLLTQKATLEERYHQGGTVGYIITGVLCLGLLIALERLLTLGFVGMKIRSQLKNLTAPRKSNPLGRILMVYRENKEADVENLELKLDEAILRETPKIERGVAIIKILAAIAPLLGLLGTVTGMIGTFQSITLFGTGDPKIMAGDISMALVTTAMGLIAALPLLFFFSVVSARSKSIINILDQQSAGFIAEHAESEAAVATASVSPAVKETE